MKNILIPTDFSENAQNAIQYALDFYKEVPCHFYLLHVTQISNYATLGEASLFQTNETIVQPIVEQVKTTLNNLVLTLKKRSTNKNHHFIPLYHYNFFIDTIKTQIEEKNIDLIVMGTKGASGISEVLMGSNTGDIITQVQCPVLIIPENATFNIPKEIAFPTDYNIFYPSTILNTIKEFITRFNSSLKVLHIAPKYEILAEEQLENKSTLRAFFKDEKHSFHRITSSKIESGIQCFVESRDITIIIMVAKNTTLFQRIMFRPTVEEISFHTDIPFLVLHE